MFLINFKVSGIKGLIKGLAKAKVDVDTAISRYLQAMMLRRFDEGGIPKWQPLSTGLPSHLYKTGYMRKSMVTHINATATQSLIIVGTDTRARRFLAVIDGTVYIPSIQQRKAMFANLKRGRIKGYRPPNLGFITLPQRPIFDTILPDEINNIRNIIIAKYDEAFNTSD